MIINCDNCNKKFNVDDKLLPPEGRMLKCGYCENTWFFDPNQLSITIPAKNENLTSNITNETSDNTNKKNIKKDEYVNKDNLKSNNKPESKKKNNILNNLLIILISFVAIIFVIDTFKYNISTFLPEIIPLLDSFYETIFDMQLFIKDLIS